MLVHAHMQAKHMVLDLIKWHPLRNSDLWILGRHLYLASQLKLTGIFVFCASRRQLHSKRKDVGKGYHFLTENLIKFNELEKLPRT